MLRFLLCAFLLLGPVASDADQTFVPIRTDESLSLAASKINNNDAALRSSFSGTAAPSDPVAGQLFFDTDDTEISYYDGSTWVLFDAGGGSPSDHGGLTGLGDDDHPQYLLLAGRSSGQSIVSGTGSGEDLTIRATSDSTAGTVRLTHETGLEIFSDSGSTRKFAVSGSAGTVIITASGGAEGIAMTKSGTAAGMSITTSGTGDGIVIDTTIGSGTGLIVFSDEEQAGQFTSSDTTSITAFGGSAASTDPVVVIDAFTSQGATVLGLQVTGPAGTETFGVQLDGTAYSKKTLWEYYPAATFAQPVSGTWSRSAERLSTTSNAVDAVFPIPVVAGDVITQVRVKWQGGGTGDGVAFVIQKRDDSSTTATWTDVGTSQTPTAADVVTVTTYNVADETVAEGYSYIIKITSVVADTSTGVLAIGVEKSKRVL